MLSHFCNLLNHIVNASEEISIKKNRLQKALLKLLFRKQTIDMQIFKHIRTDAC